MEVDHFHIDPLCVYLDRRYGKVAVEVLRRDWKSPEMASMRWLKKVMKERARRGEALDTPPASDESDSN